MTDVVLKQEPQVGTMSDADKAALLAARKAVFTEQIDTLADNLYSGKITIGLWEEDMRTRMRMYLGGAAMIGKGGPSEMTPSDWGKVGAQLKKQYNWLHGFSQAIYDNRDTVTLEAIKARAHLYAEAGNIVATEIQAGYFAPNTRRDPEFILPWIPGDGSTRCLNRCGCTWFLDIVSENESEGTKTVQAVWTLNPLKEHCEDCLPRDGHTVIVDVPSTAEVPSFIGLGGIAE